MQIWSSEIKELETLYTSIKGRFPELEKELARLIKADDENMVLLYSRRCLEVIITDLCESELKRPRKTEPLKGIIDKLNREDMVPSHIIASMHSLNSLSTFGAHPKDFDPEQVKPVLNNLTTIIRWYLKYNDAKTTDTSQSEETKAEVSSKEASTNQSQKPKNKLVLVFSGFAMAIVIVVVALFVFDIIGGGKQTKELDKSIAVLPFESLSSDTDMQYQADGVMDAIVLHLSKIRDLRVTSRTSVEQYRDTKKTIPVICEELGVDYVLEGSFQRSGDHIRLIVQLIQAGTEGHVWANNYDREWKDVFSVQSEVAQDIAVELKAVITPVEKERIERIPTSSLTAYDLYQRARFNYYDIYLINGDLQARDMAEFQARKCLEYDSSFAMCYVILAGIHHTKLWQMIEPPDLAYFDTCFELIDLALSYDPELGQAYIEKALLCGDAGQPEKVIPAYEKALEFDPNNYQIYYQMGWMYLNNSHNLLESFRSQIKAATLHRGPRLPAILGGASTALAWAGFPELSKKYLGEVLELRGDSSAYFLNTGLGFYYEGDFQKAHELYSTAYRSDSNNIYVLGRMAENYLFQRDFEASLSWWKKYLQKTDYIQPYFMPEVGYAFMMNGSQDTADYYLNMSMDNSNHLNEVGTVYALNKTTYYWLAACHAVYGRTGEVLENLRIATSKERLPLWMVNDLINHPLYDKVRSDPDFQQIVRDVEEKYQREHERVRQWLEENDIL